MKKIIVFMKNIDDPSSYYRLYQYFTRFDSVKTVEYVNKKTYHWYYDGKSKFIHKILKGSIFAVIGICNVTWAMMMDRLIYRSDIVIINRTMLPRVMPPGYVGLLRRYLNKKVVIWDFDDNILNEGEITFKESFLLEKMSEEIVVTNQYLKNTISEKYWDKVTLMPTTDSSLEMFCVDELIKKRKKMYNKQFNLIWIGTKNNLQYIEKILNQLIDASKRIYETTEKKVVLKIICNANLKIDQEIHEFLEIQNILWTRERSLEELKSAHIGLMPLEDTEYTRGKGGFKAVQYIGAGIPAVVSDVGFNSQVIDHSVNGILVKHKTDWIHSIYRLATDEKLWMEYSQAARLKWEKDFNSMQTFKFWKDRVQN